MAAYAGRKPSNSYYSTEDYYHRSKISTLAYYYATRKANKVTNMKLVAGSYYASKEDKLKPEGEDAHFISHEKQTVGVADGVGGCALEGIDSGKYARELMKNSLVALNDLEPFEPVDLKKLLQRAYDETKAEGSFTACIVNLRRNKLQYVSVGDGRVLVFRNNQCVFSSLLHQQGSYNPYQLGNGPTSDRSSYAHLNVYEVEANDVVVVGTGGLFDNIYSGEIGKILSQTKKAALPEEIASAIGAAALAAATNTGKYDDITVVVVARIEALE